MRAPASGFPYAGPFTAGAPGTMRIEVARATGVLDLYDASGKVMQTLTIDCAERVPAMTIVPLISVRPAVTKPSGSFPPPATGKAGDIVTLVGSHLGQTREAHFGDVASPYLSVVNDSTVLVETPPHAKGKVTVTVRTLGGNTTTPFTFS